MGGFARLRQGLILAERIFAEIDNDIAEIARVTALIERFGERHQLPEAFVFHIKLAFDELLTNIISYGFLDGRRHKITAWIGLDGDRVEAEIVDEGIAFNPLDKAAPDLSQSVEERDGGGLGIHFVRAVMDRVDYRRSGGKNHLKMVKKVPAKPAS
jgi:anti-sigma regulatory factor (Ser/Thr protein kinase)